MGLKSTGKYCKRCHDHVMAQKNGVNHILHLILSIVTVGFWLPIWFLLTVLSFGGWRCTRCGRPV